VRADLDLLCISVYCTADDLFLPDPATAAARLSDAEIVTLCVASAPDGDPKRSPVLASSPPAAAAPVPRAAQPGCCISRTRLTEAIEWLCGVSAAQSPGFNDDLVLLDSTPVECGRSLETTCRSDLAEVCGYGYCKSHSRWFWGMRLHLVCALEAPPRRPHSLLPTVPNARSRCHCWPAASTAAKTVVCDKGYAGSECAHASASSAPRSSDQPARTSLTPASIVPRSGN
jgi:hypothetical protein